MRHPDWPQRLDAYVASRRTTWFHWGDHDCCRFAAGAVEAITGDDRMAGYDYSDERTALRLIRDAGSLDALVVRALGETVPPALAQRGDVVIADLEHGPTLGVCLGMLSAFVAQDGLTHRPTLACRAAWRIE
jgi:hypothetical protein